MRRLVNFFSFLEKKYRKKLFFRYGILFNENLDFQSTAHMINANDLIMIRHNKNKGKLEISDGLIFPSVKEMKKAIKEQKK